MPSASDLALFGLLVEAGAFHQAAKTAGMSAPGFSKRISKLESELKTQLVYRSTRSLSLTEAGKRLWEHARIINLRFDRALAEVSEYNAEPRGEVCISVPTISGDILLADTISDFCEKYPRIRVDLRLDNNYVDLIRDGVDIAIRTGQLQDSSLKARLLIESDWVVCASEGYLQRHGAPDSPQQLLDHNCLIYSLQDGGAKNWLFKGREGRYSLAVGGSLESNNGMVLKRSALRGHGIIYVPRCLVHRELCNATLKQLFKHQTDKRQGVYAVSPFSKVQSLPVRLLIDHTEAAYGSYADWFQDT
ncbi:LysR substrate-binding domain-containing protein [Microbulbifer sp. 2304DJ12-6]|uniref:LysR family transcriptional regulator n=1 Tax=Microbulbifer sp. 2304DJ12-6 TaxID=3233340 RepID=UPI0039AF1734